MTDRRASPPAIFVVEAADATFLLNRTGLTWGNLSSHLSKLEDAGYVEVEKTFRGKKPLTMIQLTGKGRVAFENYRSRMQEALSDLPWEAKGRKAP
jgi:DNA-binding MarR family transcriptional regulator